MTKEKLIKEIFQLYETQKYIFKRTTEIENKLFGENSGFYISMHPSEISICDSNDNDNDLYFRNEKELIDLIDKVLGDVDNDG